MWYWKFFGFTATHFLRQVWVTLFIVGQNRAALCFVKSKQKDFKDFKAILYPKCNEQSCLYHHWPKPAETNIRPSNFSNISFESVDFRNCDFRRLFELFTSKLFHILHHDWRWLRKKGRLFCQPLSELVAWTRL